MSGGGARGRPRLRRGGDSKASVKGLAGGGGGGGRWSDTFLKSDILREQSGHWPHRAISEVPVQEPYRLDLNVTWMEALRDRSVLVVHPLNASSRSQLAPRSAAIWCDWAARVPPQPALGGAGSRGACRG